MNTQNTSHELRALNATEVDAVSGAAAVEVNMGLFGILYLGGNNGCASWLDGEWTDDGIITTSIGICPRPK